MNIQTLLTRLSKLSPKDGASPYYAVPTDLFTECVGLIDVVAAADIDKYYRQVAVMSNLRHKLNEGYITRLESLIVAKTDLEDAYKEAINKTGNKRLDERNMKRFEKMLSNLCKV